MKYALRVYLVCNDQGILDAIATKIPSKLDSKIWSTEYESAQGVQKDMNKFITFTVRFNTLSDRTTSLNWMKNKAETVKSSIISGEVYKHDCDHYPKGQAGCSEVLVWSK